MVWRTLVQQQQRKQWACSRSQWKPWRQWGHQRDCLKCLCGRREEWQTHHNHHPFSRSSNIMLPITQTQSFLHQPILLLPNKTKFKWKSSIGLLPHSIASCFCCASSQFNVSLCLFINSRWIAAASCCSPPAPSPLFNCYLMLFIPLKSYSKTKFGK